MGIFDKIKDAIWGSDQPAPPVETGDPVKDQYLGVDQATTGVVADVSTPASNPTLSDIAASDVQPVSRPADVQTGQNPATTIDVTAQLDAAAKARGQDLNWRTSIVDLMKVVGMDASLQERKDLARELDYEGDTSDTAAMNMWLHKQLMRKLAENGGRVPAEFLD